jgi:hypothetical protein
MAIEVYFDGGKKVNAIIQDFTVKTDQPVRGGGDNSAPAPFTLFLPRSYCIGNVHDNITLGWPMSGKNLSIPNTALMLVATVTHVRLASGEQYSASHAFQQS